MVDFYKANYAKAVMRVLMKVANFVQKAAVDNATLDIFLMILMFVKHVMIFQPEVLQIALHVKTKLMEYFLM